MREPRNLRPAPAASVRDAATDDGKWSRVVLAHRILRFAQDFACGLPFTLLRSAQGRSLTPASRLNLVYSALACFRMGRSESASFHRPKKSWYAVRLLAM